MQRKIFIAISLPENIKKKLDNLQLKWLELPVNWVKTENLHITLSFLGYLTDEELLEVLKIVQEICQEQKAFSIKLNRVSYGPPKKMPPRMIWVQGEKNKDLAKLQKDIENSFFFGKINDFKKEIKTQSFTPHITLGRIRGWEFRKLEPEERLDVEEEINLSFKVDSIEVMESELKRNGPKYIILETYNLKEEE